MGNSNSSSEKKAVKEEVDEGFKDCRSEEDLNPLEVVEGAAGQSPSATQIFNSQFTRGSINDLSNIINREEDDTSDDTDTDSEEDNEEKEVGGYYDALSRKHKSVRLFHGYEVRHVKELGKGEFGRTHQATIKGRNSKPIPVAVKVFHTPMIEEICFNVLADMMRLKHRNVAPIWGLVLDDGNSQLNGPTKCPRVLSEFFPERDLLTFVSNKENPQDYNQLGKFALDIVNGCEYLHSRNVVHGNLTARNILVERSVSVYNTHYNAKIADYGVAQLAIEAPGNSLKTMRRWWPKEMFEMSNDGIPVKKLSFKTDVWAFGVVLWEMWTKGAVPYGPCYSLQEVQQFLLKGWSPLSIHRPYGCPDNVVTMMRRILKVNPDERPTFKALKEEFIRFRSYGIEHTKPNIETVEIEELEQIDEIGSFIKENPGEGEDEMNKEIGEIIKKTLALGNNLSINKGEAAEAGAAGGTEKQDNKSNTTLSALDPKSEPSKLLGAITPKFKPKPPPKKNSRYRPPPHIRDRERNVYRSRNGSSSSASSSGRSSSRTSSPPPYSPVPLPSHFQVNLGSRASGSDRQAEIRRLEIELQRLRAEDLQEEFYKKQAEMEVIMQKFREISISSITGGDTMTAGGNLFSLAPQPVSPPPPYRNGDRGKRRRGGRGRSRGNRDLRDRGKNSDRNHPPK